MLQSGSSQGYSTTPTQYFIFWYSDEVFAGIGPVAYIDGSTEIVSCTTAIPDWDIEYLGVRSHPGVADWGIIIGKYSTI